MLNFMDMRIAEDKAAREALFKANTQIGDAANFLIFALNLNDARGGDE